MEKQSGTRRIVRIAVIAILIVLNLFISHIIISMIIKPTFMKGSGMLPNIEENDYLIVYRLAYKFGQTPKYGDVIVFKTDTDELLDDEGNHKLFMSRVIGVPGDRITIEDDNVYKNGIRDDQSYTRDGITPGKIENAVVPEGKLFCMGDNREVSVDSRTSDIGFVDQETIVGKVVFRLFPTSRTGFIR